MKRWFLTVLVLMAALGAAAPGRAQAGVDTYLFPLSTNNLANPSTNSAATQFFQLQEAHEAAMFFAGCHTGAPAATNANSFTAYFCPAFIVAGVTNWVDMTNAPYSVTFTPGGSSTTPVVRTVWGRTEGARYWRVHLINTSGGVTSNAFAGMAVNRID